MWVSEVRLVVLDGLVPPVKAVPTAVAVPVCSFKPLLSFNGAHDLTVVTATQHLQACEMHKPENELLQKKTTLTIIFMKKFGLRMRSAQTPENVVGVGGF